MFLVLFTVLSLILKKRQKDTGEKRNIFTLSGKSFQNFAVASCYEQAPACVSHTARTFFFCLCLEEGKILHSQTVTCVLISWRKCSMFHPKLCISCSVLGPVIYQSRQMSLYSCFPICFCNQEYIS